VPAPVAATQGWRATFAAVSDGVSRRCFLQVAGAVVAGAVVAGALVAGAAGMAAGIDGDATPAGAQSIETGSPRGPDAPVLASSTDPILGFIDLFAGDFSPYGQQECNGDLLPVASHRALHALLGDRYGGNARSFALPNLMGSLPRNGHGLRYTINVLGLFPTRAAR